MAEGGVSRWEELTSPEAAREASRDPVLVLHLAAIEQHGPHLPLSTDLEIGTGILAEACARLPSPFPVWTLPPQSVGASREHRRHAGTLSLEEALVVEIVFQLGASASGAGVRRLVILNSHGGNRPAVDIAALRLREFYGLLVVKAQPSRFTRPENLDLPESEWRHGFHGGAVETAMMLHLRPDLVRRDLIRPAPSLGVELERSLTRLGPEGEASFAWLAEDLHPTGVVGDPTLASAAMGARLVAHYGGILAEVLTDAHAFPLDRLA